MPAVRTPRTSRPAVWARESLPKSHTRPRGLDPGSPTCASPCPLPTALGIFWPWPLAVAQERLGELKELLDAELISQAEFDAQRANIIQSL